MNIHEVLEFSKEPLKNFAISIIDSLSEIKQCYKLTKEIGIKGTFDVIKYKTRRSLMEYLEVDTGVENRTGTTEYVVSYESKGRKYNILLNKKCRRPINKVVLVVCAEKDVTTEFRKWLGPYYDFHGYKITPQQLGYEEPLWISLKDGTTVEIQPEQTIEF